MDRRARAGLPSFAGAFLSGSAAWLPGDADLPATSDVDVMVVTADPQAPTKLGKLPYGGVLLDVAFLSWDQLGSGEDVLASYQLAGSFRTDTILADPTGRLAELHATTARNYAKRSWVRRRCQHAERRIVDGLGRLDASEPFHHQVTAWLFPTGVTTHVLLTPGCGTRRSGCATWRRAPCSTSMAMRGSTRSCCACWAVRS